MGVPGQRLPVNGTRLSDTAGDFANDLRFDDARDAARRARSQRGVVLAFAAYLLFVVYGSLVPLNFVPIGRETAVNAFAKAMSTGLDLSNRADFAANVLLFIPLTFLAMSIGGTGRRVAPLIVVLCAFGLSVSIEYLQIYFPPREVSASDIVAETVGGALGVVLWLVAGDRLIGLARSISGVEPGTNRLLSLLRIYLAGMIVYALLPLDLTLSATEIFRKWRDGRVLLVPFSFEHGGISETAYNLLSDLAMWMPVGFLWKRGTSMRASAIIASVITLALAIEFLKLFVESRISDSTHVVMAIVGATIGVTLAGVFNQPRSTTVTTGDRTGAFGLLWIALCALWLVVLIQIFWFPFNATLDLPGAARRLREGLTRTPFELLFYQDYLHASTDLLRRVMLFMPFGALCALIERTRAKRRRFPRLQRWVAMTSVSSAPVIIELGQLFLPQKTPDLTDVMLGIAGSLSGYALIRMASPDPATVTADGGGHRFSEGLPQKPRRRSMVVGFLTLCAVTWIATHAASVPYNISKLVQTQFPVGTVGLLVATMYMTFGVPVALVALSQAPRFRSLLLPPVLLSAYAIGLWLLLRISVPLPMIEKVVGTPVLGWLWELEDIGRFASLALTIAIAVALAAVFTSSLFLKADAANYSKFAWMSWSIVALPIAFHVIVTRAATDNLVELIADNAGVAASSCVFAYMVATAAAGSCIAVIGRLGSRKKRVAACLAILTLPVGYLLLKRGLEPILFKYGQAFSAMQFLLSANRASYAGPFELLLRFVAAHLAIVFVVAITQWPFWSLMGRQRLNHLPEVQRLDVASVG